MSRLEEVLSSTLTPPEDRQLQIKAAHTVAVMLYPDREAITDVLEAVGILPYASGVPSYERTPR